MVSIHVPESLDVPYLSSGQELGDTRKAMTRTLLTKDIEKIISENKHRTEKYYVLVHAKPFPNQPNVIKIKILPMNVKPSMMLSCLLFGIDNLSGKLTLEWALPGNWPVWSVGGTNEPVPETIGSINELGLKYNIDSILAY